jgi:hypothetical protein
LATYLSVQHDNILNVCIGNIILDPSILTYAAHANSMCAIAVDILDENVGCVGLRTEAIVANIDPGVSDSEAVDVVRVPSVGVLGKVLPGVNFTLVKVMSRLT